MQCISDAVPSNAAYLSAGILHKDQVDFQGLRRLGHGSFNIISGFQISRTPYPYIRILWCWVRRKIYYMTDERSLITHCRTIDSTKIIRNKTKPIVQA
jgi:hypothetical protein